MSCLPTSSREQRRCSIQCLERYRGVNRRTSYHDADMTRRGMIQCWTESSTCTEMARTVREMLSHTPINNSHTSRQRTGRLLPFMPRSGMASMRSSLWSACGEKRRTHRDGGGCAPWRGCHTSCCRKRRRGRRRSMASSPRSRASDSVRSASIRGRGLTDTSSLRPPGQVFGLQQVACIAHTCKRDRTTLKRKKKPSTSVHKRTHTLLRHTHTPKLTQTLTHLHTHTLIHIYTATLT